MKLRELLRKLQGEALGLDSNFFLHHLRADSRFEPVTSALLHSIEAGKSRACASILVLHDLLLRLSHSGDAEAAVTCQAVLAHFPNLKLVVIDEKVAAEAARLQVEYRLDIWTALHLASARSGGARFFITSQAGVPALPEIEPIRLDSIRA